MTRLSGSNSFAKDAARSRGRAFFEAGSGCRAGLVPRSSDTGHRRFSVAGRRPPTVPPPGQGGDTAIKTMTAFGAVLVLGEDRCVQDSAWLGLANLGADVLGTPYDIDSLGRMAKDTDRSAHSAPVRARFNPVNFNSSGTARFGVALPCIADGGPWMN